MSSFLINVYPLFCDFSNTVLKEGAPPCNSICFWTLSVELLTLESWKQNNTSTKTYSEKLYWIQSRIASVLFINNSDLSVREPDSVNIHGLKLILILLFQTRRTHLPAGSRTRLHLYLQSTLLPPPQRSILSGVQHSQWRANIFDHYHCLPGPLFLMNKWTGSCNVIIASKFTDRRIRNVGQTIKSVRRYGRK